MGAHAVALGAALTVLGAALGAQPKPTVVLTVIVHDDASDEPVIGASVEGQRTTRVVTDSAGRARLIVNVGDTVRVRARRLGYTPMSITLPPLTANDSVLVPIAALELAAFVVQAKNSPAYLRDFEQARKSGTGRFIGADDLEKLAQTTEDVADLITRRYPGLRPEWSIGRDRVTLISLRGRTSFTNAACSAKVFLNGRQIDEEELATISTRDIAGLAYYTTDMPARYRVSNASCGVVAMWARAY